MAGENPADEAARRQLVIARDFRIRRSELVCPGNSPQKMAKAAASDADQTIFDLEDALAVSQKEAGRQTVIEALRTLDFGGKIRTLLGVCRKNILKVHRNSLKTP